MSDYVIDCESLDPCDVWDKAEVVARKVHRCSECNHPIVPGERYTRLKSLFEGSWSTEKTCRCCEAARCAVAAAYSRGDFQACITPGNLWAAVDEGIRDGWLDEAKLTRPEIKKEGS